MYFADYLLNVMNYDLDERQREGLRLFQQKCVTHGLIIRDQGSGVNHY